MKKINQLGFSHIFLPLLIVVLVALVGTFMLVQSKAACEGCAPASASKRIKTQREKAAEQVLDRASQGKIRFHVFQSVDNNHGTTARQSIISAARGHKSATTRDCDGRDGVKGSRGSVYIDTKILLFLRDLADETTYTVTSITGQCHSSSSSNHYRGKAVDIGCPFTPAQVSAATRIGAKYGIKHNSENCTKAGGMHYHFSVGGR